MNMFDRIGPFNKASLGVVQVNEGGGALSRAFSSSSWLSYIHVNALNVPEFTVAGTHSTATNWLAVDNVNCLGGALQPMRSFNPQGKRVMIEVDYSVEGPFADLSYGLVVSLMEGEQVGPGWNTDNDISSANLVGPSQLGSNSGTFQVLLENPTGIFPDADLDKSVIVAIYCHNVGGAVIAGKHIRLKLSARYCVVGTECLDLTK